MFNVFSLMILDTNSLPDFSSSMSQTKTEESLSILFLAPLSARFYDTYLSFLPLTSSLNLSDSSTKSLTFLFLAVLLNILIAQFVRSYEKIAEDQEGYAKMNRAWITVEMESFLSLKYRNEIFDGLGFDIPLELDQNDHGPAGGVQVRMYERAHTHSLFHIPCLSDKFVQMR